MRLTGYIFTLMFFAMSQLTAQTAREEKEKSANDIRSKHLVERFEKSVMAPKSDIQEKIRKSKARKQAILWHIENSGLKENQRKKLKKALENQTKSKLFLEFVAKHEKEINEFVKDTTAS